MSAYFVTGTDTGVGKTFIAQSIMHLAKLRRLSVVGYKPIASGCMVTTEGLRNEDALNLQQASTLELSYEDVNPFSFQEAVAPHLAAAQSKRDICLKSVSDGFNKLQKKHPDMTIVEGAGGWRLPVGNQQFLSEFVLEHKMPVILVVGVRLGCLNHAVMTAEIIKSDGLELVGWVANHLDSDMPYLKQNVESLKAMLDAPMLGEVPMALNPKMASEYLDITPLLQTDELKSKSA